MTRTEPWHGHLGRANGWLGLSAAKPQQKCQQTPHLRHIIWGFAALSPSHPCTSAVSVRHNNCTGRQRFVSRRELLRTLGGGLGYLALADLLCSGTPAA